MFDIAWTELLVLAVIIIVVVGPRDLPKVMRSIGRFMRRARALASQFQSDLDELAREAEIEELRKQARAYQQKFREPVRELEARIDPAADDEKTATSPPETASESAAAADPAATAAGERDDGAPLPEVQEKDRREAMSGQTASGAAANGEGGRG